MAAFQPSATRATPLASEPVLLGFCCSQLLGLCLFVAEAREQQDGTCSSALYPRPGYSRTHSYTGAPQDEHTDLCIDQPDELVKVLEPRVGVLIVEVPTHGHHDVVTAVVLLLQGRQTNCA